jgi:hypothetical protein
MTAYNIVIPIQQFRRMNSQVIFKSFPIRTQAVLNLRIYVPTQNIFSTSMGTIMKVHFSLKMHYGVSSGVETILKWFVIVICEGKTERVRPWTWTEEHI